MRVEEGGEYSIPGAHPVWEQVPALEPLGVCVYYFFFYIYGHTGSSLRCTGLLVVVHTLLTAVVPLVVELRLQVCGLRGFGSWTLGPWLSCSLSSGRWGHPRPGVEPVSPASAGRFFATKEALVHIYSEEFHNRCFIKNYIPKGASLVAQTVKRRPAMRETRVRSLGREGPLEKDMATHPSTLAWKIPWTEDPGRLQSRGSQRVGHD